MKALSHLALVFLLAYFLVGCGTDVGDLNRRVLLYAIGFDRGPKPGSTTVTVVYPSLAGASSSGMGGSPLTSLVLQAASAQSLAEALSQIELATAGRLWTGSLRLVVFGEGYARQGVADATAFLLRLPEVPDRTYTAVVAGTARAFLAQPSPYVGSYARHVVEEVEGAATADAAAHSLPLYKLFDEAHSPVGSAATVYFSPAGPLPTRSGLAVFQGARLKVVVPSTEAGLVAAIWRPGPSEFRLSATRGQPLRFLRVRSLRVRVHPPRAPRQAWQVLVRAEGAAVDDGHPSAALGHPEFGRQVARQLAATCLAVLQHLYAAGSDPLRLGELYRERTGSPPPPGWYRDQKLRVRAVVRLNETLVGT